MSTMTLTRPEATQVDLAERSPRRRLRLKRHWVLLGIVVAYVAILAIRLRNTAFIDEALYINAGHSYLAHWFDGQPLGDAGAFFSGLPTLYPVLAALLDSMGGLYLVRVFSLTCILSAAFLMYSTARHLWGQRGGLLTAATFLLSGPVVYMGWLGTFDALVIAMLALGLWVGLTRSGIPSAVLLAAVLTLAALTKYTAGVFIPVVLAATLVFGTRGMLRAGIATGAVVASLATVWMFWGADIGRDLAFTTTERQALSPTGTGELLGLLTDHLGLLILLAALALFLMFRERGWRLPVLGLGLVLASMMLPIGQMILGEAVSFEKHLAYSVLMLSLPIGWSLARVSRYPLMVTPVVLTIMIMALFPLVRADSMYRWPNVAGVVEAISSDPQPGLYISSATDSIDYHTRAIPDVSWETTFELYYGGEDAVLDAVKNERYQSVILRTSSVGNAEQDGLQAVFLEALDSSPSYSLSFEPFPASPHNPDDRWLIYSRH
ncbi:hypothetical protein ABDK96_11810 [Citricoccus nitrophenolicus]|uniref:Glycosyltransferase RgtA/B/C/D-like domain-containing protein n=1 Tax=Citricoccus nitrophenolicus TaxID=863575 RepID=A0ABV0IJN0_9MICC